jgi:large subunit ribosomal protein L10
VTAISTPQKVEVVAEIGTLLEQSTGTILTDYRGLTVAEITELRRRLREQKAEYHVVKNTLFRRAIGDGAGLDSYLQGPTAVAFALEDPVGPAKILLDFIREKRKAAVKGGYIDGRVFDLDQVTALSKLPPRPVLLSQVVGTIQSPISGLVYTLQGVISNFVYTLQAIADQKGGS